MTYRHPVVKANNQIHKRKRPMPKHRNNISPFAGNIINKSAFNQRGHDVSGFIKREMVIIDRNGNKRMARETQFINSFKRIGRVCINDK